eukprot:gnl/TRDRNA2_/TRDRNA2_42738_c0_seq1.p1 gnl/TRDRNA2_/TRDRNA2_42738_c0~~gnl/TRDRNA2_/TRDRNA2_42738_c0_seq1.p1  ORF type:complete len:183 (+),score=33.09 gnl/TRDRNA2_/TRDRNA2_42738_c0_seq1:117-665(+)
MQKTRRDGSAANTALRRKLFAGKSKRSRPADDTTLRPSPARLVELLQARGITSQVAAAVSNLLKEAPAAESRRLLAGLARHPGLGLGLNSGTLTPADFIGLSDDALATAAVVDARCAAAAARSRMPEDSRFRLDCPECGAENARGVLINSAAGAKPMLGRCQMVTRGECSECGHVWVASGRE